MILVLFAYCIAGGVHNKKIHKSTVQSLMEQPTQFSATPSAPKAATGMNIRHAAAGSCSFPTVLKSCREEREQEVASKNTIFYPIIECSEI